MILLQCKHCGSFDLGRSGYKDHYDCRSCSHLLPLYSVNFVERSGEVLQISTEETQPLQKDQNGSD